jgi:hypothetical protein
MKDHNIYHRYLYIREFKLKIPANTYSALKPSSVIIFNKLMIINMFTNDIASYELVFIFCFLNSNVE